MPTPEFKPGFRFSFFDAVFLVLGALGAFLIDPGFGWPSFCVGFVVGHFFLFCNVFRISRDLELIWVVVFLILALLTLTTGTPTWLGTALLSLVTTGIVVGVGIWKPSYHGVGWQRWNPDLRRWWENALAQPAPPDSNRMRIPNWLYALLLPVLFFGGCVASIRPVWKWMELGYIHPVTQKERKRLPVLGREANGKYTVASLEEVTKGIEICTVIPREDEAKINQDLRELVQGHGDHRYFQVLSEEGAVMHVSLEEPTKHDSMWKSWYSLENGVLTPERVLSYGPGFAFVGMHWNLLAGLVTVVIFHLVVRRRIPRVDKPLTPSAPTPTDP